MSEVKCSSCGEAMLSTALIFYVKKEYPSKLAGRYYLTVPLCPRCYEKTESVLTSI